jgi:hypothetical protein
MARVSNDMRQLARKSMKIIFRCRYAMK